MNYGAIYYGDGTPATDALVRERFTHMLTAPKDVPSNHPSRFPGLARFGYSTTDSGGGMREWLERNGWLREDPWAFWPDGTPVMVYGAQMRHAWNPWCTGWNSLAFYSQVGGLYVDNCAAELWNTGEEPWAPAGYAECVRDLLLSLGLPIARNISSDWHSTFEASGERVTLFCENAPDMYGPVPVGVAEMRRRVLACDGPVWIAPGFSRAPSAEDAQLAALALYLLVRREDTVLGFTHSASHAASHPDWMRQAWHPMMEEVRTWGEPEGEPFLHSEGFWIRIYERGVVSLRDRTQWDDPLDRVLPTFETTGAPPEPDLGDLVEITGDVRRRLRTAIAEADKAPASYARLASVMAEAGLQVDEMPGVLPVNVQANIDRARAALEAGE